MRRDFANSALFVAKDPRICRLLPLWHAALEDMGFAARHIIIVRHPIEIVASLTKRRKTSQETALLLWMRHVLQAERASRGKPRVFVSYDVLLADWRPVVDRIAAAFNIDWPIAPENAKAQIEQFLKRDLRHHVAQNDLELPRYVWPRALYQASLASLENERGAAAAFDEIRQGLIASDELHIDYRDQAQLVAEIQRQTDFNRALNNNFIRHRETVTRVQAEAATLCGHIKYRDTEISQLTAEIDRITEISRSRDNELIRHRETVSPVRTEAVTLWSHIRYRDTEIGRLKMEIEGLNSIVATAEKRSAYQSEVARLREELAARESELNRLTDETVNLRNQLENVTTSWTWRATKPLRLVLAISARYAGASPSVLASKSCFRRPMSLTIALISSLSKASAFSSLSKMPTKSSTKPRGFTISAASFS